MTTILILTAIMTSNIILCFQITNNKRKRSGYSFQHFIYLKYINFHMNQFNDEQNIFLNPLVTTGHLFSILHT